MNCQIIMLNSKLSYFNLQKLQFSGFFKNNLLLNLLLEIFVKLLELVFSCLIMTLRIIIF